MADSLSLSPTPVFTNDEPDHVVNKQPSATDKHDAKKSTKLSPKQKKEKTGRYIKSLQTGKHELQCMNDELREDYSSLLKDLTESKKINDELSDDFKNIQNRKDEYKHDYQKQVHLNSDLLEEINALKEAASKNASSGHKSDDSRKYKELFYAERRKRKGLETQVVNHDDATKRKFDKLNKIWRGKYFNMLSDIGRTYSKWRNNYAEEFECVKKPKLSKIMRNYDNCSSSDSGQ